MSSALETRLAETLAALPGPSPAVEARARAAALDAVPPPARVRVPRAALVAAAVVALLALGAAALAAVATIRVATGAGTEGGTERSPSSLRLAVPAGAAAIAVVAGGRLWLSTRSGTRIEGLPVGAAELSPRALYAAVGIGRELVAMSPGGRRAWSYRAPGRVEAIAWSPDGLRIAYLARSAGGVELRTIEGDGDHDRLVAARVRAVRPSWRADSLALAYVGAGGRPVVYDLGHRSRRVVGGSCADGGVRALAFAPAGERLAYAGAASVGVDGVSGCVRYEGVIRLNALAWTSARRFVTTERSTVDAASSLRRFALGGRRLAPAGFSASRDALSAVAVAPSGLVLVRSGGVVLADAPGEGIGPLRVRETLLRGPLGARVSVAVR